MDKRQRQRVTILLVEDDPGHAELIRLNLQRSGVSNEILHFRSGNHVIEFLLSNSINLPNKKYLMILDLNMPGMNGLQVLDRVKNHPDTKTIPVIIVTTATDEKETEFCYELGCNVFISKPIEYDAFSKAIQELGLFLKTATVQGTRRNNVSPPVVYY